MNAIILAAGLGKRLRPLTADRPKCLVEVLGQPMIERQIRFLLERGIEEIVLVSGYKADRLNYLESKYGVKIIHNPLYETVNNIYSLYVAKEYFGDTYMVEGDVYMHSNCFLENLSQSSYFAVSRPYENEWGLICDDEGVLKSVNIGSGSGPIMSGISYWTHEDAGLIRARLSEIIAAGGYEDLFWDNIVLDILPKLNTVKVRLVDGIYEIDTKADLEMVEKSLSV